jgi:uncharacterized protein YodC (DUF2158 family)
MNDEVSAFPNAAFEIGDIVSLNSGGHMMTIISIDNDCASCDWSFEDDIKSKSYSLKVLKVVLKKA